MLTPWGEKLDRKAPLREYPRPQLRRDSYLNLNGLWDYAITDTADFPPAFEGSICVPFSPESELSGVFRQLGTEQYLHYRRSVDFPEGFFKGRMLLHFGAVDQHAVVYWNDQLVGEHEGGYTAFCFDVTDFIGDKNELLVTVWDKSDTSYHSRGKQKSKRGGIWYTAQSGIWQTVWMESVPQDYIEGLNIVPLFDEGKVSIDVSSNSDKAASIIFEDASYPAPCAIPVPSFVPWSPETPNLYEFSVQLGEDEVQSYFAMRKFSVDRDEHGVPRLFLNNKPYFHHGILDQGYYSDGLYTAPSDEAMIFDIRTAKSLGFNMLRKHIKIEPMRWYYHCDRLGMLVWQDMINGGGRYNAFTISSPLVTNIHFNDSRYALFARRDVEGRSEYYQELEQMILQLKNVPSIAMWVPFNEGWGQFDAKQATQRIRALDSTRTIDHASGWHDQGVSDVKSLHVYFKKYRFKPDRKERAVVLSEFGGYNLRIEGHSFNQKDFGYKRFSSLEQLSSALAALYRNEIAPAKEQGLAATVYTQLSDVEDELNGLITYDRRVVKLSKPIDF